MCSKGKVVIAGGSGFIGRALVAKLTSSGYEAVVLSRSGSGVVWDGRTVGAWASELEGAAAVVNLCGSSMLKRWTDKVRAEIMSSRVDSSKAIGQAVQGCKVPPKVWVNASGVGFYGDTGEREVSEATKVGDGFLSDVCKAWEGAVDERDLAHTRRVKLRIGMVLGHGGGAFPPLAKTTKLFAGGNMGDGTQYVSWIHVDDLVRMVVWAIENPVSGVVNATAPNPVHYSSLMNALRKKLGRPPAPSIPRFVLEMMSQIAGPPAELILMSQRVVPEIALARGFEFRFSLIEDAVGNLVDDTPVAWKID